MTTIKNILAATALVLSVASAHAAEQTFKPLQAVSFHAGAKHAVGYFLAGNKACKLVLTMADDANFVPVRIEADLKVGESNLQQFAEGKSLKFVCHGEAMSVTTLETTAAN